MSNSEESIRITQEKIKHLCFNAVQKIEEEEQSGFFPNADSRITQRQLGLYKERENRFLSEKGRENE